MDPILVKTIIGALMPVLVSVILQVSWSSRVKSIVAFILCIIAGVITSYAQKELGGEDIVKAISVIMITSMAFYQSFWKPSGVTDKIETVTSLEPSR